MPYWKWSRNAAANATADPAIGFAEGQSPSSLNDSCRAVMAVLAQARDDTSGSLVSSGTTTAYTLTTYSGLPSPPSTGQSIAFTAHATNGSGASLNVDGGGAYPVVTATGVPVSAGILIAGSPYTLTFSGSAWILQNFFGSPTSVVPVGGLLPYLAATPPNSSFALPYGQALSRSTYSVLFNLISTVYGPGDGATTFNIPDYRGRVLAGADDMGGTASNRLPGFYLAASGGEAAHTLTNAEMPSHNHGGTTGSMNRSNPHAHGYNKVQGGGGSFPGGGSLQLTAGLTDTTDINHEHGISADGGSASHNNVQPTQAVVFLLRII